MRIQTLLAFLFTLCSQGASVANPVTEQELTRGPWQFGLVGNARSMPIGLAFNSGVTAAVVRFLPDGKARVEIPCRNDEFIKKIGENMVYIGAWKLINDELSFTVSFRGHAQTETGRVEIQGEEMRLFQKNGVIRSLGRFHADVNEPCRYE